VRELDDFGHATVVFHQGDLLRKGRACIVEEGTVVHVYPRVLIDLVEVAEQLFCKALQVASILLDKARGDLEIITNHHNLWSDVLQEACGHVRLRSLVHNHDVKESWRHCELFDHTINGHNPHRNRIDATLKNLANIAAVASSVLAGPLTQAVVLDPVLVEQLAVGGCQSRLGNSMLPRLCRGEFGQGVSNPCLDLLDLVLVQGELDRYVGHGAFPCMSELDVITHRVQPLAESRRADLLRSPILTRMQLARQRVVELFEFERFTDFTLRRCDAEKRLFVSFRVLPSVGREGHVSKRNQRQPSEFLLDTLPRLGCLRRFFTELSLAIDESDHVVEALLEMRLRPGIEFIDLDSARGLNLSLLADQIVHCCGARKKIEDSDLGLRAPFRLNQVGRRSPGKRLLHSVAYFQVTANMLDRFPIDRQLSCNPAVREEVVELLRVPSLEHPPLNLACSVNRDAFPAV